ncbi:DUF805 domain-containing protein [Puerhibacterium sp. TATVAM-FAB25]|uniref:DUF805 domain-containing protein n=1 Tax=Puerhibacterium sp. TATVAM-FAB25 TaxID=3093699 RepID=UPI00397C6657
MSFPESIRTVFSKYATFSGRARRSEYWWWALFTYLVSFVLAVVVAAVAMPTTDPVTGSPTGAGAVMVGLYALVMLALVLPSLAVAVRRLHDTDKAGWWVLLNAVPFVGPIVVLVLLALEGTPGPNRFGPDPKGTELPAAGYGAPAYPGAGQPPAAY